MAVTISNFKGLIERLNPQCKQALELSLALTKSNTHHYVEIEHWLLKLLEPTDGDLARILKHLELDRSRVVKELNNALENFRRGKAGNPQFSTEVVDWMREGWSLATLEYGSGRIRSAHLLAALVADRNLRSRLRDASPELFKIDADRLREALPALMKGTTEDTGTAPVPGEAGAGAGAGAAAGAAAGTAALDQFTQDLTAQAKAGKIDPVVGRDTEIRQVIDILTRRRQNNPILTGEAGVGKTAVVEGFALRVAANDVPDSLKNVQIRILDLALLQAGAGVKGEFENRLKNVLNEVKSSPIPIILFIDEAHTMIGAGGQQGQGDAANLLKPALARGELRTIAATTWAEYKKYFEDDAALKRRFQVVKVAEPDIEKATRMMRGLTGMLEKHHKVRILAEAVEDSVRLSARYITDRQLPDKSVSLLDTACARVALSQTSIPPAIEDTRREIDFVKTEIGILQRERAVGAKHDKRLQELQDEKKQAEERLAALEKQWENEKVVVEQIRDIRGKLEKHGVAEGVPEKASDRLSAADEERLKGDLSAKMTDLAKLQGKSPLVQPVVTSQAVAEVVSGWTGVPLGKMVTDEIRTVLGLKDLLAERVIGQDHALESIAQRIRTARANLADPRKPLGVFMLVGPSGVGKTETAVALSEVLYGGDRNMIVINMSEYKESAKVSSLIGSSKGYVGYGEGGVLTEAVRRKPYSVVLLDEIEKAHVDVQELFFQVFDKGMLQDTSGNDVNFKNTIILLTSNVGTDTIERQCADPETCPEPDKLAELVKEDLLKVFKPAFLGRTTVVPYFSLSDEVLKKIIKLKLKQIGTRIRDNHKAVFEYDDKLIDTIASRCQETEKSGARNVDYILTGTLLPDLAGDVLTRMAEGKTLERVHVGVDENGGFKYDVK